MSEKMRSEFEAWYESAYGISLEREFRSNHFIGYVNDKANHRWAAWQASRAALCVELPGAPYMPDVEPESLTDYEQGEAQGRCDMWSTCRSAIHAAGVKTR